MLSTHSLFEHTDITMLLDNVAIYDVYLDKLDILKKLSVWQTLLNACQVHRDIETVEALLKSGPKGLQQTTNKLLLLREK